jgi:hypothetical protein
LIGTYQRISFDDLSDRANAVIFGNQNTAGLVDRAPAAGKAALGLWAGSVVVGATGGAGLYALGPSSTVTTLGLGGAAAEGTTAASVSASVSALIRAAGQLTRLTGGVQQGFIRGNPQQIIQSLT